MSGEERYPAEELSEWDDNGTMPENVDELRSAVVGRRIVRVERRTDLGGWSGVGHVIHLDDGRAVKLENANDCCAYTELESFLLHADKVDHVITGVGTTGEYTTWHVYAEMGDVLELTVGWSAGNPFYYGYGFDINVSEEPKP